MEIFLLIVCVFIIVGLIYVVNCIFQMKKVQDGMYNKVFDANNDISSLSFKLSKYNKDIEHITSGLLALSEKLNKIDETLASKKQNADKVTDSLEDENEEIYFKSDNKAENNIISRLYGKVYDNIKVENCSDLAAFDSSGQITAKLYPNEFIKDLTSLLKIRGLYVNNKPIEGKLLRELIESLNIKFNFDKSQFLSETGTNLGFIVKTDNPDPKKVITLDTFSEQVKKIVKYEDGGKIYEKIVRSGDVYLNYLNTFKSGLPSGEEFIDWHEKAIDELSRLDEVPSL